MPRKKQTDIKKTLKGYSESFQKDGKPISVNFRALVPELKKAERYTHLIHSYPAKLLTNIPYFFFATDTLCPSNGIVLDPFCGTGTVLLEAALSGRNAWGADSNPLAELITRVKTSYLSREDLLETLEKIINNAKRAKINTPIPEAVAVWYSPSTLPQLAALQTSISRIKNKKQKAFFELCFSIVVRKVSLADPSISVPVHLNPERFNDNPGRKEDVEFKLRALKDVDVFDKFDSVCKVNIGRIETLKGKIKKGIAAKVVSKDARQLGIPDESVDLILTSPPYAGAQKYIRASWLNLHWLNLAKIEDIRELKTHNIGREDYRQDEIFESYTGIEAADAVLKIVKHVKNEFIFSNPGTLLITKTQYYNGGQSVCRNKSLQKMFMMLGAAEKAGSGVDKILKGWSDANWRVPYIETTLRPDTVNLYLPMLALLDDNIKNGLVEMFGGGITSVEHNYLTTLSLAYSEGYVTNERLRYVLNLHKADITILLRERCAQGYLESEGYGRGTKYHLPQKGKASNIGSNLGSNLGSKPKRRLSRDELRKVILGECEEWVSLDYIATAVDRNPDYLLTSVIPSMLEEGLIERMYPKTPRNPYQKYKRK